MIGRALVFSFCAILITCFIMQCLLLSAPIIKKLEFERVCHDFCMIMDRDGGLTTQNREKFVTELENRGFTLSYLYADNSVPYGEKMTLEAEASYKARKLNSTLVMEELPLLLNFQSKILSRKTVLN